MDSKSQQGQASAITCGKGGKGLRPPRESRPLPCLCPTPQEHGKGELGWVHAGRGVGGVQERGMMSGGGWMDGNGGRVTWAGGQMDLFRDGKMCMDERGW